MALNLSTNLCLSTAREMACCCRSAYDSDATICDTGTDTQVLVDERPEAVVVAFRGSSSVRDWVTDAEFEQRYFLGDERVHHGFLDAMNSVIEPLFNRVGPVAKPIYVTGHSLGGALAQLCAYWLAVRGISPRAVYTFGSPRVGNRAFAEGYDNTPVPGFPALRLRDVSFRFVHGLDIVPRIPWLLGTYRHAGREVFLAEDGGAVIDASGPIKLCSDAWNLYTAWRRRRWVPVDLLLLDHRLSHYRLAIEQLRELPA